MDSSALLLRQGCLRLFCCCDMSHEIKLVWIRATDRNDKIPSQREWISHVTRGDLLQQPVAVTCRSDLSHSVSALNDTSRKTINHLASRLWLLLVYILICRLRKKQCDLKHSSHLSLRILDFMILKARHSIKGNPIKLNFNPANSMDLFSLGSLFSHFRPRDIR